MSKVFALTVCHMDPATVAWSVFRFIQTNKGTPPYPWVFVDNKWPVGSDVNWQLHKAADLVCGFVCRVPDKNLGGHGGATFGLKHLRGNLGMTDNDYVLGYDPDSNPLTPDWLKAMKEALDLDPTLGAISLMHEHVVNNRAWTFESHGGPKVAFDTAPEMANVTMWRASVLKEGFKAPTAFYGFVETAMFEHMKSLAMRWGYLYDYRETTCPIPHPESYNTWKRLHCGGNYLKNFDEYLKEKGSNGQ